MIAHCKLTNLSGSTYQQLDNPELPRLTLTPQDLATVNSQHIQLAVGER